MQKTRRYFTAAKLILLFALSQSCRRNGPSPSVLSGEYTRKNELDGDVRGGAVTFTIGDTAYVGLGYNGTTRFTDFWGYNPISNSWTQEANFPGTARNSAVAFAVGAKGYVGTGYDGNKTVNDFWCWSQAINSWDSIAPLPGTARQDAVAFTIGNYGYVTTGYDGTYQKDLWQFDPNAGPLGKWEQKTSFGGEKRSGAIAFVYGTKGYVVTGYDNGVECGDFWYYDAMLDQWVKLRNIYNSNPSETYDDNYTNIERDHGVGFVIGDSAYIMTGENGGLLQSAWGYNFATDQWVQKQPFEGTARKGAVGFSLSGYGYICTGTNNIAYFDDLILFNPNL